MNNHGLAGLVLLVASVLMVVPSSSVAQTDIPGSKDHPLFSRMPGYYISEYRQEEFAAEDFLDENCEEVTVEGQLTEIVYTLPDEASRGAKLKILRNFSNAITRIGGRFCDYAGNSTYMMVRREGQEIWSRVYATEDYYSLTIVQKGEVRQEITASWLLDELDRSGRVALYLRFDTGKADLLPESEPVLDEITALLAQNADLKLQIQGHTDDVGDDAANLQLSEKRALAVRQALLARDIAGDRLTAAGFGESAPIADNATEEGRAQNRRVELVKM